MTQHHPHNNPPPPGMGAPPQQQQQQPVLQQNGANPGGKAMEPPPLAIYSSLEELIAQANAHAGTQGYKLVVVRSKTNTQGQKTWVHLACDRHGVKRNTHNLTEETRKKNRRSRRCECPMYCVAVKTNSGLWELTVRNREHNHGPYEPPPKKKKDLPPPPPSELINLELAKPPAHCVADFCLVPIGTGSPSVSAEIAEVQRLLKRSGLTFTLGPSGTTVEGSWEEVMRIIGQAHALLHANGVARINTDIRVGTRNDKKQSAQDKLDAVRNLLNADTAAQANQLSNDADDDTTMGVADDSTLGPPPTVPAHTQSMAPPPHHTQPQQQQQQPQQQQQQQQHHAAPQHSPYGGAPAQHAMSHQQAMHSNIEPSLARGLMPPTQMGHHAMHPQMNSHHGGMPSYMGHMGHQGQMYGKSPYGDAFGSKS